MKRFSEIISAARLLVSIYALHDTAGEKSVNIEHHEQTSYGTERHVVHLIGGNELIRSSMVNEENTYYSLRPSTRIGDSLLISKETERNDPKYNEK